MRVWSLSTGQCARTVDSPSLCCAWSPDRYGVHGASPALLVTGGADGVLRVWDVAGGSCVRALSDARPPPAPPHTAAAAAAFAGAAGPPAVGRAPGVTCVAVAPDGANLLSGSHDACLRVWSAATGRRAALLLGHAATVYCCAFSRDGRAAASAAGDGEARTWDPATGACRAVLAPQGPPGGGIGGGGGGPVFACCFGGGADGRLVLTAGGDGRLRWWDGATGECLATLRADGTRDGGAQGGGGEPAAVFCAAIRPDGRALAAGDASGRLRLWTRL